MEPVNIRELESMDGFSKSTHQIPIRKEWSYILDQRRNEALSAFRYDVASFLRIPLDDVSDFVVRADLHTIQFTAKYTALLTTTDIDAIMSRCEFHEMTLLVYDSYFPDGFEEEPVANQGPATIPKTQRRAPRDPTEEDRAYRMYFPGRYWEEVLQQWRVEAEMAAKKDILQVLQATEIVEKPPKIPTKFKCERDGMWMIYSVEDGRDDRRLARRDFFARNTFSQLWALYAERSSVDAGWMRKGESRRQSSVTVPLVPTSMDPQKNVFPAIVSEEPDGEVTFPGSSWHDMLRHKMKQVRKAGKEDVIRVLEENGELFHGSPHVKVRFEVSPSGARMLCKVLNALGLTPGQIEARRRILSGHHYPRVMNVYDAYVAKKRVIPDVQRSTAFQLPTLLSYGGNAGGQQSSGKATGLLHNSPLNDNRQRSLVSSMFGSPRYARRNSASTSLSPRESLQSMISPKSGFSASPLGGPNRASSAGLLRRSSPSKVAAPLSPSARRNSLMEYDDKEGQRPCTYRCLFQGSHWKRVVQDFRSKLHESAVQDVQNCFIQTERLRKRPAADVEFTLRQKQKGIRAFFTFHEENFSKPLKKRHDVLQRYDFPLLWELYSMVSDLEREERDQRGERRPSLSRSHLEADGSLSFSSDPPQSPRRGLPQATSSTGPPNPNRDAFTVPLGEPGSLPPQATEKSLEFRIPFHDVKWREALALDRAAEVDHIVRRDILTIFVRVGVIDESTKEPPCIISTFVPVGDKGALLYIKFSRRDRRIVEKARAMLLDNRNYPQLLSLCNTSKQ